MYKSIVRPVITYGCSAWHTVSDSTYNKLQILQNKFLRVVGNYPRYTPITKNHNDLKIEMIKNYKKNYESKFFKRGVVLENSLLNDLNYNVANYKHKRIKHRLND